MKVLKKENEEITLELTHGEFNFIGALNAIALVVCDPEDIYAHTGGTYDDALAYRDNLREIAQEANFPYKF